MDISFDVPSRDWSAPVTRPTVNLYLYDLRENTRLRETYWDQPTRENGRATVKRLPLRMDVSYLVTCWTSAIEDQHRLLWRIAETLFRHSPLPEEILQGALRQVAHPVWTEVAQSDGVLKNISDFWAALDNQLRPSINLQVTLDLDLNEVRTAPMVFSRTARVGRPAVTVDADGGEHRLDRLAPGWEDVKAEEPKPAR